jgi:hypothetical protein
MTFADFPSTDPAPTGLHRVGEAGRCLEAGSSKDASGYVRSQSSSDLLLTTNNV